MWSTNVLKAVSGRLGQSYDLYREVEVGWHPWEDCWAPMFRSSHHGTLHQLSACLDLQLLQ